MSKKRKKTKSTKGKVVIKKREFVPREAGFKDVPHSRMKGSGIYALYNNYGLYYIGLSNSSLRARIRTHSRHKKNWTMYSWYQIPRISQVKDIESILLHIINPQGNKQRGRFKSRRKKKKR